MRTRIHTTWQLHDWLRRYVVRQSTLMVQHNLTGENGPQSRASAQTNSCLTQLSKKNKVLWSCSSCDKVGTPFKANFIFVLLSVPLFRAFRSIACTRAACSESILRRYFREPARLSFGKSRAGVAEEPIKRSACSIRPAVGIQNAFRSVLSDQVGNRGKSWAWILSAHNTLFGGLQGTLT